MLELQNNKIRVIEFVDMCKGVQLVEAEEGSYYSPCFSKAPVWCLNVRMHLELLNEDAL